MSDKKNKVAKRAQPTKFISHWPKLIDNLSFSSQEFYVRVEKALADRQVPELRVSRVDWKEGGPLSPRREYLRLTRERLVFDVCAAPFGTGFFVSLWFGEKPLKLGLLGKLLVLASILEVLDWFMQPRFGLIWWLLVNFHINPDMSQLVPVAVIMATAGIVLVRVGPNLDAFLIQVPVLGFFYERYFRTISYYRIDRRCMYQTAVHAAVTHVIDEITTAHGIQPLSEFERRPVMRELFHRQGSNGRN